MKKTKKRGMEKHRREVIQTRETTKDEEDAASRQEPTVRILHGTSTRPTPMKPSAKQEPVPWAVRPFLARHDVVGENNNFIMMDDFVQDVVDVQGENDGELSEETLEVLEDA
jgi:hypothetical protein